MKRSAASVARTALLAFVGACAPLATTPDDAALDRDVGAESLDAMPASCSAASEVVHFDTTDGVTLEADLRTTGAAGAPAVVLLHMIPPSNDRHNYPPAFIDALISRGIDVLNVDRRGAGGSTGIATEAYTGPNGRLDASAAIAFLAAHACAIDRERVGIVGASNGTTTMLDYTVGLTPSEIRPRALVYLTAGTYTENQHLFADGRATLDPIAALFVFATSERAFSVALMSGAPATWAFREYDPGAHGTRIFSADGSSIEVVADFLARALGAAP